LISTYFQLGLTHILDIQGYDHMLFLLLLLAGLRIQQWKELIGLITAFTFGHSVILAIVTLYEPLLSSNLVEFLIPITILITGMNNLMHHNSNIRFKLALTLCFGLIHGMGFASYLSALMSQNSNIWEPLLYFNLGVEAGQIIFVSVIVGLATFLPFMSKNTIHKTQNIISILGVAISIFLAASNWPFL